MKTNSILFLAAIVLLASCDMSKHYAAKRINHSYSNETVQVNNRDMVHEKSRSHYEDTTEKIISVPVPSETIHTPVATQVMAAEKTNLHKSVQAIEKSTSANISTAKKIKKITTKKRLRKKSLIKSNAASVNTTMDFWEDGWKILVGAIVVLLIILAIVTGNPEILLFILALAGAVLMIAAFLWFCHLILYILLLGMIDAPWGLD